MAINQINPWGGLPWLPTSAPNCPAPTSPGCGACAGGGENELRWTMMRQLQWMESMLERLAAMLSGGGGMPCPQAGAVQPLLGGCPSPCGGGAPAWSGGPALGGPQSYGAAPGLAGPAASAPAPAGSPVASTSAPGGSGQKAGAPPGYKTIKGAVPPGVTAKAKSLLNQPMGSEHTFEIDGKSYLARLEHHYHPPGYQGGPNGWHKGVSVYEKV